MTTFNDDEADYFLDYSDALITPTTSKEVPLDDTFTVLDSQWARNAFLISSANYTDTDDIKNRFWSSASTKFTDTRMGGSIGVNARPQWCRYSDIRVSGLMTERTPVSIGSQGNHGMGRFYSEAIDDNSQVIYMRFGVPQYTSLLGFFMNAFSYDAAKLARTGNTKGVIGSTVDVVGHLLFARAFPPIALALMASRFISFFFSRPVSKYYTLKPTMFNYWVAVNSLVQHIAVNIGLLTAEEASEKDQKKGATYTLDETYMKQLHNMLPGIILENGVIDVKAIANRAQVMANVKMDNEYQALNRGTEDDYIGFVKKYDGQKLSNPPGSTTQNWLNQVVQFNYYVDKTSKVIGAGIEWITDAVDPRQDVTTGEVKKSNPDEPGFFKFLDAEFRDGSQFAVFRVDHTGPANESFSNAVGESDISSKLNSVGSTIRENKFSFSGGNISDDMFTNAAEFIVTGVKETLGSVASMATGGLSNIFSALTSGSYMDIPKNWKSSTANLPRMSYTMTLISPYNNPVSRLQNIYIPLAMIMCGTLPLSAGKQSYVSPFLVQVFDKGRAQTKLGIIDSLSITRGTSNLGFSNSGQPLAIDVTFTITDLSSIMHMPIGTGSIFDMDVAMDEDNILYDYLAVLSGQDIYSQIYMLSKAQLKYKKLMRNFGTLNSKAYWASWTHHTFTDVIPVGNLMSAFVQGNSTLARN